MMIIDESTFCNVEEFGEKCPNPVSARLMCQKHYARWKTHGNPLVVGTGIVDLLGQRFGYLVVLKSGGVGSNKWSCHCDCGNTIAVYTSNLTSGHTTSCGCKNGLSPTAHAVRKLFEIYKLNAKTRSYAFDLTIEQFTSLIFLRCHYCKIEPRTVMNTNRTTLLWNGVDRVDNSIGYTIDNCVTCCELCNHMKGTLNENEFLISVYKIFTTQYPDLLLNLSLPRENIVYAVDAIDIEDENDDVFTG
jgi:hypothetical protein